MSTKSMRVTDNDDSLAPSACPLSSDNTNPVTMTVQASTDLNLGVELDADAKIQFQGRSGQLQRPGNLALVEPVEKIVCRNRLLHDILVGGAFHKMLPLSRRVLGPDLVAVDTLY